MNAGLEPVSPTSFPTGSAGHIHRSTPWFFRLALTGAAFAVGFAIHIRDGEYWPSALRAIGWGIVLTAAGVTFPRLRGRWRGGGAALVALFVAVAAQFYLLLTDSPGGSNWWSNDLQDTSALNFFVYSVLIRAGWLLLVLALAFAHRRAGQVLAGGMFAVHLALGVWMIRSSPRPHIDVYVFQQVGAQALLSGDNPYAISYPDIYRQTQQSDRPVYGPGLSGGGQLGFGFPYTPLSLVLSTLGYLACGDHRYAQLLAMTLAGGLIAYNRPGRGFSRVALLAAAGYLFTPRVFFVLGRGWTEPFVALGLTAAVFVARRMESTLAVESEGPSAEMPHGPAPASIRHSSFVIRHWPLSVTLGLFLATKQYLILALPAALVLLPRPLRLRSALFLLGAAMIVAVALTAPLAVWDLPAFIQSTWTVQKVAPFREDALSFAVWLYRTANIHLGTAIAFLAVVPALVLGLRRGPRGAAGFAATTAFMFLPFIALNKQAFANYYYFTIAALWAAVAAAGDCTDEPRVRPGEPCPA